MSKIIPGPHLIVVQHLEQPSKSAGGIQLPSDINTKLFKVIATAVPWVDAGKTVLIRRGTDVRVAHTEYLIVMEEDILAIVS